MKHLKLLLTLVISCLSSLYLLAQKPLTMKNDEYEKSWKLVQDAESKSLPETALKTVNEIYAKAKAENNAGQLVKAIIHKLKFTEYKEEDAFTKNLQSLENEAKTAAFPVKPLLYSMLAEMYWHYYEQNRWQFQNRTQTVNFDNNDLKTWTLEKIVETVFQNYQLSLAEPEKAKATQINVFEVVLQGGNELGKALRPTLYDFLAQRALNFYISEEPDLTKPAYAFTLSDKAYLGDSEAFIKLNITSKDTQSQKLLALKLFQELLKSNANASNPDGFVFLELQRLQFVRQHLTLGNKDELYLEALEKLEQKYSNLPVSTIVTYYIVSVWAEQGRKYKPLQGDAHKNDLRKAYDLAEAAKKRFPKSDGAAMLENFQNSLLSKNLTAKVEQVNLTDVPFRALVNYQNIKEVYWKVIVVSRIEIQQQRKKYPNLYDYEEKERRFIQYFLARPAVRSGKVSLPDDGDLQTHSAEIKLDGVSYGDYMVIFSHSPDFKTLANGMTYAFTTVSNLAYMHRNRDDGSTEFFVVNRTSGEPVAGAKADIYISKYNSNQGYIQIFQESVLSDDKGFVKVPYQTKRNSDYYDRYVSVNFSFKNDKISTRDIEDENYYQGSIYQNKAEKPQKHRQTFFFLDRAIYRPGQTLYYKGLLIETDGKSPKILPNQSVKVMFYDVNSQIVAEKDVTTNEYGTFSGTFTTPSSGLTGQMRLQTSDYSGTVGFSVEEYKRPKFEVVADPLKGSFKLGETVKTTGKATAFSGAGIDGAKVKYRVVRKAEFPYWYWRWWGYFPNSPEMEIVHGETQTDAEGKYHIDFQAIADESVNKSSEPTFTYTVFAEVTDINGETHSTQTYVSIGYKTLKISTDLTDLDLAELRQKPLSAGTGKQIRVTTTNLMGTPETAPVSLKIYKLKTPTRTFRERFWERPDKFVMTQEEFYKNFPQDLYKDELNVANWEVEKTLNNENFDTKDRQQFYFYTSMVNGNDGQGTYKMEISAKDKDGQETKEIVFFTVYDSESKKLALPEISHYKDLKTYTEPGEKAAVLLGSADKVKVLYESEQDGNILSQSWLTLQNEQTRLETLIEEKHRGNIALHYAFVKNNRFYHGGSTITVPFTNKQLDIQFETFRDKLQPGQQEQWKIKISGKKSDKVMAEMVATLYDASLDAFRMNGWYANFYNYLYARLGWTAEMQQVADFHAFQPKWNDYATKGYNVPYYRELNWFGFNYGYGAYPVMSMAMEMSDDRASGGVRRERDMEKKVAAKPEASKDGFLQGETVKGDPNANEVILDITSEKEAGNVSLPKKDNSDKKQAETDFSDVKIRKNFNETAFFFPHLQTDDKGSLVINFTIPEALTRWKMLGFAHTKDLQSGYAQKQLVTQKDLMVVPNQPRFFREGDKMTFSAKITSLSDQILNGEARLEFIDALSQKPINIFASVPKKNEEVDDSKRKKKTKEKDNPAPSPADNLLVFTLNPKQSTAVEWQIAIPAGVQALTYRIVAKAGNFSDGEEMMIPVVTNRMLVTETLPLPIRGNQTKTFELTKLKNSPLEANANPNVSLKNQRFTLEFTSNPAWYAVQALPYLMEYPYECVEQTFSRFYANAIASQIANSNPKIKQVFDTWATIQPEALLSNLEKNQELKTALLEETPWVLNAKDESQRKRQIALLFDLNRMANEQERALAKVLKAQQGNGGFSWFPGFPEDRYMTQHIVSGLAHLDAMQVKLVRNDPKTWQMTQNGLSYLENQIVVDYERLRELARQGKIKLEDNHLDYIQIQFLYAWSYFRKDRPMSKMLESAIFYYKDQAKKYWTSYGIYLQGMLALALNRSGDTETPKAIIKSLNERALHSEEMGMYWKQDRGWYWYQAPIETQALLIEVYDEVANDTKSVDDLKTWLLKQKQTQDWKTTKATSEACFALLRRGTDFLASSELVQVQVGDEKVNPAQREDTKFEAGTGYFKTAWTASQIKPEMGTIKVTNPNPTVAWGAVYWQYFEDLDKITASETPLSIKKQLFLQQNSDKGIVLNPVDEKTELKVGDLVTVRIELRVDRAMEYVHLKDMRASGFEPTQTLSTHKYQDGLWYYESPKDLATNFFFGYLPKGAFVFEYPLRVSQKGDFSNGITTIQCMYAPEFTSHSAGIRVKMK